MPIGKDSISRVKKNGYANITSTAPDMEDSKIAKKAAPVSQKKATTPKNSASKAQSKAAPKAAPKATAKAAPKASAKSAPKNSAPKADTAAKTNYFAIGDDMPIYLL